MTVGFRPEAWHLVSAESEEPSLDLEVHLVESLGSEQYVYATTAQPMEGASVRNDRFTVRLGKRDAVHKGDIITVTPLPGEEYFFDSSTGINLEYT